MRLASIAAALGASTLLAAAGAALACSCVPYASAAEQLAEADLLFKGRVVEERVHGRTSATTTFAVTEVIKGPAMRRVSLNHRLDGAACGVRFRPGAAVLLLAHRAPDGTLRTGLCSRPRFPEGEYRRAVRGEPVPVKPPPM